MRDGGGWQKFALASYCSMRSALDISKRTAADREGFRRVKVAPSVTESSSRVGHSMDMGDLSEELANIGGSYEVLMRERDKRLTSLLKTSRNSVHFGPARGLPRRRRRE